MCTDVMEENALSGGQICLNDKQLGLTRRKATSSCWVGPVPRRGGSQEPSKLSSCFCFGADPIDGRRKVVGQDQHPSMGRFRKPPFLAMGDPVPPWWRDERTSTQSLWYEKRDEISPHEKRDKQRACAYVSKGTCKLNNQSNVVQSNCTFV
ncbi:hypothetical protein XU18_2756 [Perkinsela sp. CCAP 1560/4]|nr:hypothetical protein XU18_2756 [Perkinsela sp. CCAP 1560/4]|eukprot:KNH06251.1 hypothetical protein XU18_2756 [Perkinsela sp. CCAP 1560/4]